MKAPTQKRAIRTRERLLEAARDLVAAQHYEALRVEEIVLRAGVAKGTFFAHFADKDALMDVLIGTEMGRHLEAMAGLPPPRDIDGVLDALMPLVEFMTSERYVFDVILRYSGAAAVEEIGEIAEKFGRQTEQLERWLADAPFRKDIAPSLLAEGVQAFAIQAMALKFCALHHAQVRERLHAYLEAWLLPSG